MTGRGVNSSQKDGGCATQSVKNVGIASMSAEKQRNRQQAVAQR
jgi:hypothetical protein